jgi:hypothetical protein
VTKSFLIFLLFCGSLYSSSVVVKSSTTIKYKDTISTKNTILDFANELPYGCVPITKDQAKSLKYKAKTVLKKNRIICEKDIYKPQNSKLIFNFGTIQIEKYGKVIKETKDYYRIRNEDGTIENVYKDGTIR